MVLLTREVPRVIASMSISELSFLKAQGQNLTGARVVRELT